MEYMNGDMLEVRQGFTEAYDPRIMYADSIIMNGSCKAIVCCVGDSSSRSGHPEKLDTESDTPL